MSRSRRVQLIVILAIIGVVASLVLPPLKQPQSYHHFADEREFFGIPNFWNVISNGGFLVVGVWGLGLVCFTSARKYFIDPFERWAYAMFFFGVLLTCLGSGYYHLKPADATLVWDRLPMTIGFMSMLS